MRADSIGSKNPRNKKCALPITKESIDKLLKLYRSGEIPQSSWRRHTRRLCIELKLPMVVLQKRVTPEESRERRRTYIREHMRRYRKDPAKTHIIKAVEARHRIKRMADPEQRLACKLRVQLWKAITRNQKSPAKEGLHALSLLGMPLSEFKLYLESKFLAGMTWANYGSGWHIDHVFPLDSFDLTVREEVEKAFHWSNLQPLWALDNILKSNRLDWNGERCAA